MQLNLSRINIITPSSSTCVVKMFRGLVTKFCLRPTLSKVGKLQMIQCRSQTMSSPTEEESIFYSKIDVPIEPTKHNVSIAVINMNDSVAKNALSKKSVLKMIDILEHSRAELMNGSPIRALILRSNVPGIFCAGANLKERLTMNNKQVESWLRVQGSLMDYVSDFPCPTIAAIDGHALGGGLELALACDVRIVNEKAKVGLVETRLAIIPGAGGTQRLSRLIGVGRAKEHIFVAEPVEGVEAVRIGIANHIASGEGASFEKALKLAKKICRRGPKAVRLAKRAIDDGIQTSLDTGLSIERAYYCQLLNSKDRLEGMKAFMEKRDPIYTDD